MVDSETFNGEDEKSKLTYYQFNLVVKNFFWKSTFSRSNFVEQKCFLKQIQTNKFTQKGSENLVVSMHPLHLISGYVNEE